jgi:hypothetical protein
MQLIQWRKPEIGQVRTPQGSDTRAKSRMHPPLS